MTDSVNVQEVMALAPDYLGFIFYPQSKRYVGDAFDFSIVRQLDSVCRVAVFVDADLQLVEEVVEKGSFDAVQLHGQESPEFCIHIQNMGVQVIKAFGLYPAFDWKQLQPYGSCIDYFLFDTHTPQYGGSGRVFEWKLLEKYVLSIPFFLSGGIGPHNFESARRICHSRLHALDLNSRFEQRPGIKDILLLQSVLKK